MGRPIGIRFREASTKVHHPPSPFASQPPQLGPSLPTPRNPSPPHPPGSLERPNASPSLSLFMSPRAARSRLHVRVRADVHAAALLRACSCRGLRRTLPPHAAAVAVVRTSQRRRCSDCAAPPRVPLLPVPCGCHSHLRCLRCAQRHRRPHAAGVTARDPPGSCAAPGRGLPSSPGLPPAAAARFLKEREGRRRQRGARGRARLPPPMPLRACAASAGAAPLLPSATAAARMSAPGAPVACSYLACDCAPPARPRAPAPRRSAVVLPCRIWGRVAATPPFLRACTAGAAVDTAAAAAASASCAVRVNRWSRRSSPVLSAALVTCGGSAYAGAPGGPPQAGSLRS